MRKIAATLLIISLLVGCTSQNPFAIEVSENGRFFQYENGEPFFWLGDTGWLLIKKLNRTEVDVYLSDRKEKGFNVIQIMGLHTTDVTSFNGVPALINEDVSQPLILEGSDPDDTSQYDYWDHLEYAIDLAAAKGLFIAIVPVWGSPVKAGKVSVTQVRDYARFLVQRFGSKQNIIWLNGGDVRGDKKMEVWKALGEELNRLDQSHLITFHPRGRTMSSEWFHDEPWLDFNMFQSGHRYYDQDTARDSHRFGPDNWRYVQEEYAKTPVKPTLDGEPSYEGIPYGLHNVDQPYWTDADVRRYAYWSVFSGGAGFTYGANSVMQFYCEQDSTSSFGPREYWQEGIKLPGASQMIHLRNLMLSRSYFDRIPDQSLIKGNGEKYDYLVGTRGEDYAMVYTYTGRDFKLDINGLKGDYKASWYNPRNGEITEVGQLKVFKVFNVEPPGEPANGNDWVLLVEKIKS